MKKAINIFGIIAMAILTLTGVLWVTYKLLDLWEAMKVNTDLSDLPESNMVIYKEKFKTVYPDDIPKNFNEWASYIHKQLN